MNPEQINEGNDTDLAEGIDPPTATPSTASELPAKHKKRKKILIIIVLVIISIPLIGYLLLYIALSGGIKGVISDLKPAPNPESSGIILKRNSAKDSTGNSFAELDKEFGLTNFATSTHDRCFEGQNNWKVQDGYAHRCTYRVTKFYGFNGDFRQQLINLEQQIIDSGWESADSSGFPMKEIMEHYYDKYYGSDKPTPRNFPKGYLVSNLPTPTGGYSKDREVLEIEYAEKATEDYSQIEYAQNVSGDTLFETYEKKDFQDISSIFKNITQDNKFVLVISIQKDYFEN